MTPEPYLKPRTRLWLFILVGLPLALAGGYGLHRLWMWLWPIGP